MGKTKIISSIILSFILIACTERTKNELNLPVISHRYHVYKKDSIIESNNLLLDKITTNDSIYYYYKYDKSGDELLYSLKRSKVDKTNLLIIGTECPLIAQKKYQIENQEFKIFKYDYDNHKSSDEETSYFYCEKYGLLIVDNYTEYGLVYSFEYDSISQSIVNQILKDSTAFGIKIPLIPPAS
ncbi:hypothetical protein [Marinilabilia rubra]|uniref:Lipoprotein n=1 Tax=Marinilabilia rubra TaxID=2162893 RepID=A0A2U2B353_9BACT|nr:hypothetical protein [Marinilabilia rubra]PWD97496.1 hypothetical protein DDZ16_20445 [Marinilabilia rubra]